MASLVFDVDCDAKPSFNDLIHRLASSPTLTSVAVNNCCDELAPRVASAVAANVCVPAHINALDLSSSKSKCKCKLGSRGATAVGALMTRLGNLTSLNLSRLVNLVPDDVSGNGIGARGVRALKGSSLDVIRLMGPQMRWRSCVSPL
jgi:hypothetical protein